MLRQSLRVCEANPRELTSHPKYTIFLMLSPKRTKYRKHHRGRMRGKALRGNVLAYGNFALQALEPGWLTSRQIEAGRRTITRYAKRGGKLWIRVFPDKPITMRPAETRMGSGKGSPEYWVAVIKPGRILYEMKGIPESLARDAMRNASYKMPVKTQFISGGQFEVPIPVS